MTPRYYQEEAIIAVYEYFARKAGNPVIALPTGTGKALVIAEFIRRSLIYWPQVRFLIVTHVKELIGQNHLELLTIWPTAPAGIYSAGLKRRDTHLPITFCGIASICKKAADFGFIDIVIVDECHMISDRESTMYAKAFDALKVANPLLKVIGLTATPFRLGMGMITEGRLFDDICIDYCQLEKFNELVDAGFISPLIPKRTGLELDVTGVGMTQGEFNSDELQAAVDKDSITRAALWEVATVAANRWHWLIFCTGCAHADHVVTILQEMGISAVAVHSKLPGGDYQRDAGIAAFKGGTVRCMVGVGVFTTGFNYPPVDCIVVLRPTMSTVLWIQLLGRGTRPSPDTGKVNCLVLDFAANTKRLGPINDPVIPRKKGKGKGDAPFKVCDACDTYNHARARFCICCGAEFPETVSTTPTAGTEELIAKAPKEPKPEKLTVVESYDVTRVEYSKHISRDRSKPPSLLVSYYCGSNIFNEWLCLEHSGYAHRKAKDSWRLMAERSMELDPDEIPGSVDEALEWCQSLWPPVRIRVQRGGQFTEVVGYDFAAFDCPPHGDPLDPQHIAELVKDGKIPF